MNSDVVSIAPGPNFGPGTRQLVNLLAAETVTGWIRIPVTVLTGVSQGPTLAVTAACHPGEYNGIMASIRLAQAVDPEQLSGRIVIVHAENVPGVQAKVGHSSPLDGVNMGRAFPVPGDTVEIQGNVSHQAKSSTYQIAEAIFREVILQADAYIDLHGGEFFEFVPPNIEYFVTTNAEVDAATRALAAAFGFRLLWAVPQGSIREMPTYPGRGSAVFEAQLNGIPAAYCEVGGEGRVDEELVGLTLDGILRVLGSMQMIEAPPPPTETESVTLVGGHVLFAERAGMFLSSVAPGQEVAAGERLGEIVNLANETVQTLYAPQPAVLLNVVTRGIASSGDMLFVLGNLT